MSGKVEWGVEGVGEFGEGMGDEGRFVAFASEGCRSEERGVGFEEEPVEWSVFEDLVEACIAEGDDTTYADEEGGELEGLGELVR